MSGPPPDWGPGPLGQESLFYGADYPWWYASRGFLAFIGGVLLVLLIVVVGAA